MSVCFYISFSGRVGELCGFTVFTGFLYFVQVISGFQFLLPPLYPSCPNDGKTLGRDGFGKFVNSSEINCSHPMRHGFSSCERDHCKLWEWQGSNPCVGGTAVRLRGEIFNARGCLPRFRFSILPPTQTAAALTFLVFFSFFFRILSSPPAGPGLCFSRSKSDDRMVPACVRAAIRHPC